MGICKVRLAHDLATWAACVVFFFCARTPVQSQQPEGPLGIFSDVAFPVNVDNSDSDCFLVKSELNHPFAEYDPVNDEYELGHTGGDVWQQGDTFAYAYSRVSGDFSLSVHIPQWRSVYVWGKVALMVRQDLTVTSRHNWVMKAVFPDGNNNLKTIWGGRPGHGEAVSAFNTHDGSFNNGPSYDWLRIERVGNTVRGSGSVDGTNWTPIDHATNPHDWEDMPADVLVGLAVCGNTQNCKFGVTKGTFGNVELVTDTGGFPRAERSTTTVSPDCPPSEQAGGPVNVTIRAAPIPGEDTGEVLGITERARGDFGAAEVTAMNGGVAQEVLSAKDPFPPVGVDITWSVTRAELQAGVGYSINIDDGEVAFTGEVTAAADGTFRGIGGEASTAVQGEAVTIHGPFGGFGTGITRAHAVGAECPGANVALQNEELVVTGAGRGLGDVGDQLLYAYTEGVTGDFSARVRITGRGDGGEYGVMVREDCGPNSKFISILDGMEARFQGRLTVSFDAPLSSNGFDELRLDRVGSTFNAYVFDESGALAGVPGIWVPVGSTSWIGPATLNVGLAVASLDSCVPLEVRFADWQVGPVPPRVARSVVSQGSDSCPGGGNVQVTIQQDLDGADPAQMVEVREFLRGAFTPQDVTPTDAGVVDGLDLGIFEGLAFPVHPTSGRDCTGTPGGPSATHDNGTYTLSHMGGDVWAAGDTFTYLFNRVRGDFDLTAQLVSTESPVTWGKTALMVRQDLTTASRLNWTIETMWPPGNPLNDTAKTVWGGRTVHGQEGAVFNTRDLDGDSLDGPKYSWLRIERVGDTLVGSGSFDGADWQLLPCDMFGVPCNPMEWVDDVGIPDMPDELLVGLSVVGNSTDCNLSPGTGVYTEADLILGDGAEIVPIRGSETSITWNVSRQQLSQGIGYTVDDPGSLTMNGAVGVELTAGPMSADVSPPPTENLGPLAFGSGVFENVHMIGTHCDTVSATSGDGELEMVGAGGDIAGASSDNFFFAYEDVTGDFSATVTVSSQGATFPAPTAASRYGIMARQSCDPDARLAAVLDSDPFFTTPVAFLFRNTHLGTDSGQTPAPGNYNEYRLDRQGNVLIGFYRDAGQWVEIDRRDWGADAPATLFLGLAVVTGAGAFDGPCTHYDVTFEDWLVDTGGGGTGFRRGDANADGSTNLADAVATFNFLFLGGDEPACLDAADSNDVDNALNLTDGVFLLNFLFLGGDPIPAPGPFDCGPEPAGSPFTFGCDVYTSC